MYATATAKKLSEHEVLTVLRESAKEISVALNNLEVDELPDSSMKIVDAVPDSLCRVEYFLEVEGRLDHTFKDDFLCSLADATLADAARTIHAVL